MGEKFSRARGYTADEIKTFNTASEYGDNFPEDIQDVVAELQYVLDNYKVTQKSDRMNVGGLMKRKKYNKGGLYKILLGDTLSSIAKSSNTSVEKLAALNKIQNPDLIYEGQSLVLPTTAKEVQEAAPQEQKQPQLIEKESSPLKEQVEKVYTGAKNTLTERAKSASSFVSDVNAKVRGSLNDLPAYTAPEQSKLSLEPAMETYKSPDISSQANATLEQTKEALSTFGQGAQQAVENVQSSVAAGVNNVTGVASDLSSQAQEVLQDTVQNTRESVSSARQAREDLNAQQAETRKRSIENMSNAATSVSDQVSETFSNVKESTGKGVTALKSLLTSGVDAVKDFKIPEPNRIKSFADPKVVELDLPVEVFKPAGKQEALTPQETEDQNQLIGTLKGFYEASGTQVAKNLLSFFNPFAGDKTEADYTPESVDALRFAAKDAISKGQGTIDYKNYNLAESNVRAQVGSGAQRKRDKLQERMFKGDITPTEEAAFSVGGGTLVIEDGNVFVTDTYDFSKLKRQIGAALPDKYAALRNWISSYSGNEFKSKILVGTVKELTGIKG
jgi:LysM repeat protein